MMVGIPWIAASRTRMSLSLHFDDKILNAFGVASGKILTISDIPKTAALRARILSSLHLDETITKASGALSGSVFMISKTPSSPHTPLLQFVQSINMISKTC